MSLANHCRRTNHAYLSLPLVSGIWAGWVFCPLVLNLAPFKRIILLHRISCYHGHTPNMLHSGSKPSKRTLRQSDNLSTGAAPRSENVLLMKYAWSTFRSVSIRNVALAQCR